jgi:pentatricopeptide repeat protein
MASSMTMLMSSSMDEITRYFSASSGSGLWFECSIFAGTFIIALVLKKYSEAAELRKAVTKKGFIQEAGKDPRCRRPQKVENVEGFKVYKGPDQTGKRIASELCKDAVKQFDDACSSKNSNSILDTYEEMKATGLDKSLIDLEKQSRHTALDFYNGLVHCAVRQGKPSLVEGFILNMRETNVPRTRAFYEGAMKMLAGKRYYQEALAVYAQLEKDGIEPSAVTYSCLVNFAVEVNELDLAVKFFEKLSALQTPSIRAYMTVLRAFSKRHDSTNSIRILNDMQQRKLEPDSLILNIVLATCVNADRLDQAESLLEEMQARDPPVVDVVSYNTVIKGYAQKGDMAKALTCLENMSAHGLKPNIITFNTTMDSAVRCKQPAQAWRVLSLMRQAGLSPDKYTCSILVKGVHEGASEENMKECLSLLMTLGKDKAKEENIQLFEVLFLSLLDASLKAKDLKVTLEIYTQLKQSGVALSPQAYNGLVRGLATAMEVAPCIEVWSEMINAGVTPNAPSLEAIARLVQDSDSKLVETLQSSGAAASLIGGLSKGRRTDLALSVYSAVKAHDGTVQLDLATYASLIQAQCESCGGVEASMKLVQDIKCAGLKPDEAVMNALLTACFKDANVSLGKKLFADLTAAGAVPNQTTYATMIKLYGRCQQLQDALQVVSDMEAKSGLVPSSHTYSCLIQACIRNKQTTQALEVFKKMKERKIDVPESLFTTLINGSAAAYNIVSGVQLIEQAFQSDVEISAATVENLIAAASRKHAPPNLNKLQDLVQKYSVPISETARTRLFANRT